MKFFFCLRKTVAACPVKNQGMVRNITGAEFFCPAVHRLVIGQGKIQKPLAAMTKHMIVRQLIKIKAVYAVTDLHPLDFAGICQLCQISIDCPKADIGNLPSDFMIDPLSAGMRVGAF